ncbi:MAG: thermonuclease family protein [Geminicoccaceae bacterium]
MRRQNVRRQHLRSLLRSLVIGCVIAVAVGLETSWHDRLLEWLPKPVERSEMPREQPATPGPRDEARRRGLPALGTVLHGRVKRVVDGDSLYLQNVDRQIRLWGLDAPEWNEDGGEAATASLTSIAGGHQLECTVIDHDRYGRIVGRCERPDGEDVVALMIRSGTAAEYRRYSGGYYKNIAVR